MFYIVNSQGEVIASASHRPDPGESGAQGLIVLESPLNLPPYEVMVAGFPDRPQVVALPKTTQPSLVLTCTAQDQDQDGVPELKADGRSSTTLKVTVQTAAGENVDAQAQVTFRTTAGRLAARTAILKNGTASVQFTAGRETVAAYITASAVGFHSAHLHLELVP